MLFTIERRLPHPSDQKVGPIGRNTSRNRLDGVDPRPPLRLTASTRSLLAMTR